MTIAPPELIGFTAMLLGIGISLRSLEVLFIVGELGDDGLVAWTRTPHLEHRFDTWQRRVWAAPVAAGVLAVRILLGAAAAWLPFDHPAMPWILLALLTTQAYYNRRFWAVIHGADTMFLIGLAGAFAASIDPGDSRLTATALLFLAAQAMLAYGAASVGKLKSAGWRNGRFFAKLFTAGGYRAERLGALLTRRVTMSRLVAWAVMLVEMSLAICPLLPTPAFQIVLALGVAFHVSIAAVMGLHTFFWSFLATYPGLYFLHHALWRRI